MPPYFFGFGIVTPKPAIAPSNANNGSSVTIRYRRYSSPKNTSNQVISVRTKLISIRARTAPHMAPVTMPNNIRALSHYVTGYPRAAWKDWRIIFFVLFGAWTNA